LREEDREKLDMPKISLDVADSWGANDNPFRQFERIFGLPVGLLSEESYQLVSADRLPGFENGAEFIVLPRG